MSDPAIKSGTYSFKFQRQPGPRFMHAEVTLLFEPHEKFEFISEAQWPEGCDYQEFVRFGCYSKLFGQFGAHATVPVKVTLQNIVFSPQDSSGMAFQAAAEGATEKALKDAGLL